MRMRMGCERLFMPAISGAKVIAPGEERGNMVKYSTSGRMDEFDEYYEATELGQRVANKTGGWYFE